MKNHVHSYKNIFTSLSLVAAIVFLASCSNLTSTKPATITSGDEQSISFQVLSKSFRLGGPPAEPSFVLVRDSQGLDTLKPMVSEQDRTLVQAVNLEGQVILAAFAGGKPSGGYSITIDNVAIVGDELVIRVLLQENDPSFPKIEATTSPYTLVTIDKTLITDKIVRFQMISGEDIIASGAIP